MSVAAVKVAEKSCAGNSLLFQHKHVEITTVVQMMFWQMHSCCWQECMP